MAFQLFVDPTAGARSAADNIMKGAGAIADRLKEEKQRRKDESKLFKANVTKAAALGLGKGETMAEAEADLSDNYTPDTIQGLLEGTMAATQQQQREAQIDATNATAAATREATSQSAELRSTNQEIQNQTLQNLVKVGMLSQKEVDSYDKKTKLFEDKTRAEIDQSESTVKLNQERVANEAAKTKIYGDSVRNEALKTQNESDRIKAQKQEQDRLDRIQKIPKGKMEPAFDSATGKVIPGMYVNQKGQVVSLEADLNNLSPEQSELSRLKGALVMLEGLNDDDLVDIDGGNQLRDLAPVGWWGSLFSSDDQSARVARERVRGAIAELEAKMGGSTGARRFNPATGKIE